jgi:F-type H+-transporting ATPase subunit b
VHALIAILAAEKTKNPLIPALNELVWGTVAFVLLLVVLWRSGVFARITTSLEERAERIQGNIEKAEQAKEEAERLREQYRQKLDEARDEARKILDEAREAGEELRKELQRKAQEESNRILEAAQAEIGAERERARRELRQEVGILAVRVAERVVRAELDEERQLALVDSYIDELAATNGGGSRGGARP